MQHLIITRKIIIPRNLGSLADFSSAAIICSVQLVLTCTKKRVRDTMILETAQIQVC